jgi:hypothetical protein
MPKLETNTNRDSLEQLMLDVAQMRASIEEKIAARQEWSTTSSPVKAASQGSPSSVAANFSPRTSLIAESFFATHSGAKRSESPTGFKSRHRRQDTNPCARAQDLTALVAAFNSPPASPTRSPKKKGTDATSEYGYSPYSPVGPGK